VGTGRVWGKGGDGSELYITYIYPNPPPSPRIVEHRKSKIFGRFKKGGRKKGRKRTGTPRGGGHRGGWARGGVRPVSLAIVRIGSQTPAARRPKRAALRFGTPERVKPQVRAKAATCDAEAKAPSRQNRRLWAKEGVSPRLLFKPLEGGGSADRHRSLGGVRSEGACKNRGQIPENKLVP